MNDPRIPSDRVPLVERNPATGELSISRPWFLFLSAQATATQQAKAEREALAARLQVIETLLGI